MPILERDLEQSRIHRAAVAVLAVRQAAVAEEPTLLPVGQAF